MDWLRAAERILIRIESVLAAASLLILLALMLLQIVLRDFFNFGYPQIEVITRYLLVICGMFGAVLATPRMRHIKIDALTPLLNERQLLWLRFPIAIFSAIVCAVMCYYAVKFCIDEWRYEPVNIRWALPFTLIYPLGFALLSFHFLMLCFRPKTT